jgi:hypothetical protein
MKSWVAGSSIIFGEIWLRKQSTKQFRRWVSACMDVIWAEQSKKSFYEPLTR